MPNQTPAEALRLVREHLDRNGFSDIRVRFSISGDAPEEKLREIVERAKARSAVFDMVSHGVPVAVEASCRSN